VRDEYTRVCRGCRRELPEKEFSLGDRGTSARCRDCRNAYQRAYRRTSVGFGKVSAIAASRYQKGKALLEKLKSGPCVDCGGTFIPRAMHFDHRDPTTKKHNISPLASSNRVKAILEEVAKCDLVCANCHAYRTEHQVQAGLVKFGRPRA
jgi:hypothetical protein